MQGEKGSSAAAAVADGDGGDDGVRTQTTLRVVVVGYGEISQRQHVPVIVGSSLSTSRRPCQFELIGIIDPVFSNGSNKTDDELPAPVYSNLNDFEGKHRDIGDGSQSNDAVMPKMVGNDGS